MWTRHQPLNQRQVLANPLPLALDPNVKLRDDIKDDTAFTCENPILSNSSILINLWRGMRQTLQCNLERNPGVAPPTVNNEAAVRRH